MTEYNKMKKQFFITILSVVIAVTFSGCSTRVTISSEQRGWASHYQEEVKIDTIPPGATVYIQDRRIGTAPITVLVDVSEFNMVQNGTYRSKALMTLDNKLSGWTPIGESVRVSETVWSNNPYAESFNQKTYKIIAYAEGFEPTEKKIVIDYSDPAFNRAIAIASPDENGRMSTTFSGERNVLIILGRIVRRDDASTDSNQESNIGDSRKEARSEYDAALAGYNRALEELDAARNYKAFFKFSSGTDTSRLGQIAGLLSKGVSHLSLQDAERNLQIARDRLERAQRRIDSMNWR